MKKVILFSLLLVFVASFAPKAKATVQTSNSICMFVQDETSQGLSDLPIVSTETPTKQGFFKKVIGKFNLDGLTLATLILGAISMFLGSKWIVVKVKLRQAGELLIAAADAIEDNKVDANEQKDLAARARSLIAKPQKV